MFYATHDADAGHISRNAAIKAFETREAAIAYLKSAFSLTEWNHETMVIAPGRFGDAWNKIHSAPDEDEPFFAPFSADQLVIERPGQHPGGRAWWITPREDVLVVEYVEEIIRDAD